MEQYNEISMDGFKVVSSDFFCTVSRVSAPTITVWDGSIGFSKQDLLLLIPSISFACFGDDYSVSYGSGNGYVVFANPKIAEALKAENDRTDWEKYIYYLQTN